MKTTLKRMITLVLAILLLASVAGCGSTATTTAATTKTISLILRDLRVASSRSLAVSGLVCLVGRFVAAVPRAPCRPVRERLSSRSVRVPAAARPRASCGRRLRG